jgi:mannose-6-phosphate isomerase
VTPPAAIVAARDTLVGWLLDHAFAIWWRSGADLENGGFHDTLDVSGSPVGGAKRARVQARQVYAYRAAGELGWQGPWRAAMDHGLEFLERRHRRPDDLYRAWVRPDGADDSVDLYDQAFVLLALAQLDDRQEGAARAIDLLERLPRGGGGGFAELSGGDLRANPNMHLFEAALAWSETGAAGPWRDMAAGQARLAMTRLIDPETGAVGEVFSSGWTAGTSPAGRRVEPGHQFEWAWLLMRWSRIAGDAGALAAALRLIELGERAGVDRDRNVAINALDGELAPTDLGTRLWPQTERLRAHLLAGSVTGDPACWDLALQSDADLSKFLDVPTPGLWRDSLEIDGAPAPASSLYHIVGAALQLDEVVRGG